MSGAPATPTGQQSGPDGAPDLRAVDHTGDGPELAAQLARRREAAARSQRLDETGVRDPLLERPRCARQPSTFSLTRRELGAEARRLRAANWAAWEIAATLADEDEPPFDAGRAA